MYQTKYQDGLLNMVQMLIKILAWFNFEFQSKLQEDYETVQTMLEEKDKEVETLHNELTEKAPDQSGEHALVVSKNVVLLFCVWN